MWNSDPPVYPQLTEEECDEIVRRERMKKGQLLYQQAYARVTKGVREYPVFNAKSFQEWVIKRGQARALDLGWDGFNVDTDNEAILKILALYFTKDERFEELKKGYSLRKGIMLVGPTGVGKTVLMELCDANPHVCYTRHDCQIIVGEFADEKNGGQKVIDYYSSYSLQDNTDTTFGQSEIGRFYDDLGQEAIGTHYKKVQNVMAQIIENAYRLRAFNLFHFTSNHTLNEMGDLYGPRVQDRLREMCNIIEFPSTAKSRRG